MQESYLDVNQRAAFFQYAYSSAPAMVMRTTGAGSKYPFTARDADGAFLNGSNSYRLRLPPNPPAALFWAVTAYNMTDGTMAETPQLLPSINGYDDIETNQDGSIDLYFAPEKPGDVPEFELDPDRQGPQFPGRPAALRRRVEFFDQSWKPDDIVRLD